MAATTGVTLLVLLLCCGQGAELPPINLISASSTETPANLSNLDDDMATIFDEILVQEIMESNRSSFFDAQKPLPTFPTRTTSTTLTTTPTKKKKARIKMNYQASTNKKMQHESQLSAKDDKLFFNDEDKEILYQIKSLAALERIVESLRKSLGSSLMKRRKKYKHLFRGGKYRKRRESLD
ncbi:sperm acrosome-associated protein 7-like [Odocoileus virginianus]|uniref:Sperm acrosome-associated protein 7-like n=1 Tax=Odocoileus virginianus TaxID=9874 RepID=A0ABM4II64_ODOVR